MWFAGGAARTMGRMYLLGKMYYAREKRKIESDCYDEGRKEAQRRSNESSEFQCHRAYCVSWDTICDCSTLAIYSHYLGQRASRGRSKVPFNSNWRTRAFANVPRFLGQRTRSTFLSHRSKNKPSLGCYLKKSKRHSVKKNFLGCRRTSLKTIK